MPVASPVGLIPGGRLPAVAALLTTSSSQISRTPAPATPDFHIGGPAVDSARDDSTVGGTPVQTRLTSPGKQVPSNGQQGTAQQAASPLVSIARSSPKATQVYEPEARFVEGRAEATQVSFQLVLPGPDDSPKISHQYLAAPPSASAAPGVGVAKRRAGKRRSSIRRVQFVAAPPTHPLLLAGAPLVFCDWWKFVTKCSLSSRLACSRSRRSLLESFFDWKLAPRRTALRGSRLTELVASH